MFVSSVISDLKREGNPTTADFKFKANQRGVGGTIIVQIYTA
jgi:hypothetical protein